MLRNNCNVRWLAAGIGIVGFTALGLTQDVMNAAPEHYRVRVENEHVREVESCWLRAKQKPCTTHPAGWYYVTKPGMMKVTLADGKVETWEAKEGEAGWMDAEGPHTSENVGKTTTGYILVEVKSAARPANMERGGQHK